MDEPEGELLEAHAMLNRHRDRVGCTPLQWHAPTARVAEEHSRDMATREYFDHISPDGSDPARRLLAGGVTWHGYSGENIARTPAGPRSAAELWLDSPPHRENVERCEFTHHGIGGYDGRWTQILIQEPGTAP